MNGCDHKFMDNNRCLRCGIDVLQLRIPDVEREVATACSDSPAQKTQDHFRSRRQLFEEVDRLIRGRVREVLPGITLEFKQQLDKDLGLEALRVRVRQVTTGLEKDLKAVSGQVETLISARVDALLQRVEEEASDAVILAFTERAQRLVSVEVARQIAKLLTVTSPNKTRVIDVKPKKKRQPER